jgi:hypothetical protein
MSMPAVFGLPHLSEDAVAAFADGVLSPAATDRARRHCADCRECAAAVRIQREAAMMLRSACNPTLPMGLLDRLSGLAMSTPLPPPSSGLPTVLSADGVPMFVAHSSRRADSYQSRPHQDHQRQDNGLPGHGNPGHGNPVLGNPGHGDASQGTSQGEHDAAAVHDPRASQAKPSTHLHRVALPLGLIASAAAVVAVGALGAGAQNGAETSGGQRGSSANILGVVQGRSNGSPAAGSPAAGSPSPQSLTANARFAVGQQFPVPVITQGIRPTQAPAAGWMTPAR